MLIHLQGIVLNHFEEVGDLDGHGQLLVTLTEAVYLMPDSYPNPPGTLARILLAGGTCRQHWYPWQVDRHFKGSNMPHDQWTSGEGSAQSMDEV